MRNPSHRRAAAGKRGAWPRLPPPPAGREGAVAGRIRNLGVQAGHGAGLHGWLRCAASPGATPTRPAYSARIACTVSTRSSDQSGKAL